MGNLVVKDNALVEASHKLNESEQRIILLAILKARSYCNNIEQLKGKELIIHADDYIKTFNVNRTTAYRVLKKAVVDLFEQKWGYKFINNKGLPQVAYRRFIQSADYIDNGAEILFKFADDIIPYLVELEKRFTVYEIEQVAELKSRYSMRLYEFFMQHFDKNTGNGWLKISLNDLRFRFGLLPNEYKAMSDFKKYVLDYSVKEINKHTDLEASYTQEKQGRTIIGFNFEFKRKNKELPQNKKTKSNKNNTKSNISEPAQPTPDLFAGFTKQEQRAIQSAVTTYIKHLAENEGKKITVRHRQNIVKKAILERWGLDELQKQNAEEQAILAKIREEQAKREEQKIKSQQDREKFKQLSEKFESLPKKTQETILNEIEPKCSMPELFRQSRKENKAHKNRLFMDLFKEYLE